LSVVARQLRARRTPAGRQSHARPLAPKEFKFPPYEIRTLANGLQVQIILHHEQPAVHDACS
jgi:hypothetical protein